MRYWYTIIEGDGVKGAKYIRSETHVLSQPTIAVICKDFARQQSLVSNLVVRPERLFISLFYELDDDTAATIWPDDFEDVDPAPRA